MASYIFTIQQLTGPPIVILTALSAESEAIALATRLSRDWEAPAVDVLVRGELLHREVRLAE